MVPLDYLGGVVEDVLTEVGEFMFWIPIILLEIEFVVEPKNQILLILDHPFLAKSNTLIKCRDGK